MSDHVDHLQQEPGAPSITARPNHQLRRYMGRPPEAAPLDAAANHLHPADEAVPGSDFP